MTWSASSPAAWPSESLVFLKRSMSIRYTDGRVLPNQDESIESWADSSMATRFGIDAELIVEHPDNGHPVRRPVRDLVTELLDELRPFASDFGSLEQFADLDVLLSAGSGAQRQRRVVQAGGTLVDVVQYLAAELAADAITGAPASP